MMPGEAEYSNSANIDNLENFLLKIEIYTPVYLHFEMNKTSEEQI